MNYKNKQKTGAELLVKCLEEERVEYIFGLPGEENLGCCQIGQVLDY